MDINVKVTIEAAPEFMAVLQGLIKPAGMHAVPATQTASTAPATAKVKKAEKPAEKAAEPVQETSDTTGNTAAAAETTESIEETAAEPTVTIEQIRALIPKAKEKVGTDNVKALLTKYDTANVTNLPKGKYDEFFNELKKLAA